MAIQHATPNVQDPRFSGLVLPTITPTTLDTADNLTLTAAQVLSGLIVRDTNGADRTDTLPTAALLVAALGGLVNKYNAFEFTIRNIANGDEGSEETITVAAGAGGTTSGTMTIAQTKSKRFLVVFTSVSSGSEAYTVYSLGTVVH